MQNRQTGKLSDKFGVLNESRPSAQRDIVSIIHSGVAPFAFLRFGVSPWRCSKIRCIFQTGIRCDGKPEFWVRLHIEAIANERYSLFGNVYCGPTGVFE
jgi:hypothetical protein